MLLTVRTENGREGNVGKGHEFLEGMESFVKKQREKREFPESFLGLEINRYSS
jgi:hypothetical protein